MKGGHFKLEREFEHSGVTFISDAACRDYDWLVVYDDLPRPGDQGVVREEEELACPPEQTILITAEPPTIKLYPECYTRQFGYVLTTHDRRYLPHKNWRRSEGSMEWIVDYTPEETFGMPEWPKSKLISTCLSAKRMKHTRHYERYRLIDYLSQRMPELDWFGYGKNPVTSKQTALNAYKYHVAVENYIHPYHWTDKISDPILALCLTFYAGDEKLGEMLPEESFVPIPIDDHEAVLEIIQRTIRNGEYEKRLPAIREARRRIVTQYNTYDRVAQIIREHNETHPHPAVAPSKPIVLRGRHLLRRNPWNALGEFVKLVRFRIIHRAK